MQTEIITIDPTGIHYQAIVNHTYGVKHEGKERAWVTYIGNHWDGPMPFSYNLVQLRDKVLKFVEENDLIIMHEQVTGFRWSGNGANAYIDNNGYVYDKYENRIPSINQ